VVELRGRPHADKAGDDLKQGRRGGHGGGEQEGLAGSSDPERQETGRRKKKIGGVHKG
jgi:hypothetical protein